MYQLLLLFALYISSIDSYSNFFRNDYEYYKGVRGWLKFHKMPAKWKEARLRCFYEGSTLASPLNDTLIMAMKSLMTRTPVFTGFSSTHFNGDYFSVEGVPLEQLSTDWVPGEPNNPGNEQCIAMYMNGTLADVQCEKPHPYICYKKKTQKIIHNQCGIDDPEYIFEARTGHCYKFHRLGQTWNRAYMACSAEGGHLAVINSETEAQVLRELMHKYPDVKVLAKYRDYIGIGFRDWSQHGIFMTVHGETLQQAGYDYWSPGQPDNYTTGEYCGSIFRDAKLDDIWCDEESIPFICEKLPESLLESDSDSSSSEYDQRNQDETD